MQIIQIIQIILSGYTNQQISLKLNLAIINEIIKI
jgi:DNA-binding CsgD family transcriptional regulator